MATVTAVTMATKRGFFAGFSATHSRIASPIIGDLSSYMMIFLSTTSKYCSIRWSHCCTMRNKHKKQMFKKVHYLHKSIKNCNSPLQQRCSRPRTSQRELPPNNKHSDVNLDIMWPSLIPAAAPPPCSPSSSLASASPLSASSESPESSPTLCSMPDWWGLWLQNAFLWNSASSVDHLSRSIIPCCLLFDVVRLFGDISIYLHRMMF